MPAGPAPPESLACPPGWLAGQPEPLGEEEGGTGAPGRGGGSRPHGPPPPPSPPSAPRTPESWQA
eukprot:12006500-Alexandrium_andersonii.AAC.2